MRIDVTAIPLSDAVVCVDCEMISDSENGCCQVCGSKAVLPLPKWIGTLGATEQRTKVLSANRDLARNLIAKHRASQSSEGLSQLAVCV